MKLESEEGLTPECLAGRVAFFGNGFSRAQRTCAGGKVVGKGGGCKNKSLCLAGLVLS